MTDRALAPAVAVVLLFAIVSALVALIVTVVTPKVSLLAAGILLAVAVVYLGVWT